jgi:ketosteroid isomerase-like protein
MNSQKNVELVQKAYSDFKSGNTPALLEALSEDVDWFIPGPQSVVPFVEHRRGRQQVAEFFSGSPNPRYLKNSSRKNSSETKTRSSSWDISGGR